MEAAQMRIRDFDVNDFEINLSTAREFAVRHRQIGELQTNARKLLDEWNAHANVGCRGAHRLVDDGMRSKS